LSRKLKPEPKLSVAKRQPPKWQHERNLTLIVWIVIPLVIALALGLVGFWGYNNYVAVWHQPIAEINKTVLGNETGNQTILGNETIVRMDYYVKMLRFYSLVSGNQSNTASLPYQTLNQIENDELTRRAASNVGILVTSGNITQEIDSSIRSSAGGNITEAQLNEIYKGWLDRVRLSEAEYRQVVEANLLREKLREYCKEQKVPTQTKQVHLYAILVDNEGNATEVLNRLQNGEDFATLAQELSTDEASKQYGGDLGWLPRGILSYYIDPQLDQYAFSLEVGNVSEPIKTTNGYYVIKVSEIDENRPVDDQYREILAASELDKWLNELMGASNIKDYLDQDKIDWAMARIK
jgi:foldase protein PrsA